MHFPTTEKDCLKIFSCSAILRIFLCNYFLGSLLIRLIFTASLINNSRMQCHQFTLGILTFATVVISIKWCIYHVHHLDVGEDGEKNVCVSYMGINVFFLHCLARWWQYFLQIRYVIVCLFQAACLYFPSGFDFLRCLKHSEGREGMP